MLEHDPEPLVHPPPGLGHQRDARRPSVAPPAFSMKFAWTGEIRAPPLAVALQAALLDHPPRPELVLAGS